MQRIMGHIGQSRGSCCILLGNVGHICLPHLEEALNWDSLETKLLLCFSASASVCSISQWEQCLVIKASPLTQITTQILKLETGAYPPHTLTLQCLIDCMLNMNLLMQLFFFSGFIGCSYLFICTLLVLALALITKSLPAPGSWEL